MVHFKITTKKYLYQLRLERIRLGHIYTTGTMNRVPDSNLYVIYLDYDYMEQDMIEGEIKHFQRVYDLGNTHLFQSSPKRFHTICLTKVTSKEFVDLMINSSCDEAFKNVPRFYSVRNWVLRAFEKGAKDKPKYLKTLYHVTARKESNAHYRFLLKLYPDIKDTLQNSDTLTKLSIISYATAERK